VQWFGHTDSDTYRHTYGYAYRHTDTHIYAGGDADTSSYTYPRAFSDSNP
jgi:hypothetical protein